MAYYMKHFFLSCVFIVFYVYLEKSFNLRNRLDGNTIKFNCTILFDMFKNEKSLSMGYRQASQNQVRML